MYVDDLLILGTDLKNVENLKSILSENFHMKDLGIVSQYLAIKVKQNLDLKITELSQIDYLENVLKKYGMQDCKSISTPKDTRFNYDSFKDGKKM